MILPGENEQPDLKNQKLEGEENVSEENLKKKHEESMTEDEDDESILNEMIAKELEIYNREVDESDGFDVGEHEILFEELTGIIYRFYDPPSKDHTEDVDELTSLAQTAIEQYNKASNVPYGSVHVLKANTEPVQGIIYYITFKATSLLDNAVETFQSRVYVGIPHKVDVELVRIKPNAVTN